MAERHIYLDHNATTPCDPEVVEVMLPYFTEIYGNAASTDHEFGHRAKKAVDLAREQIAAAINAYPDEIIFTSGATESDNIALFGVAEKYADKGNHMITCVTEHKAVLDSCKRLESMGKRVTYLPVDSVGHIDLQQLEDVITPETILISIMAANNEIGTLAPLKAIGEIAAKHNVLFHSDAAQALGQIPLDVKGMGIHLLSLSGHKVYGPKGIGVLYRKRSNPRVRLAPVIYGGGHEKGLRSGTLNVPGIVGFGKAAEIALTKQSADAAKYLQLTSTLWDRIITSLPTAELNGDEIGKRLPNNLNIYIPGLEAKALVIQLKYTSISLGAACSTDLVAPSHVIEALGKGADRAFSSFRIGIGRSTLNSPEILSELLILLQSFS
jgi:cysteine desulfurase